MLVLDLRSNKESNGYQEILEKRVSYRRTVRGSPAVGDSRVGEHCFRKSVAGGEEGCEIGCGSNLLGKRCRIGREHRKRCDVLSARSR
ncbi:hypothetical protein FMEAI12_2020009 [Parafrankia sp. Ea1.12]|nr:hypothetical protein FMEAI12_2020009 [Parafrankia sp. Ea1.12]